ncbi:MAG: 30S ribosomal protein S16 [Chlamydiota bacterium]
MGLKIRLRKQGRTNRPFYRLVLAESTTKRDGKYVETLGWYNPIEKEDDKNFSINVERIQYWVDQGAELSEKAKSLVNRGAPEIVRKQTERIVAHKAKMAAKRRARRKAASAA